MTNRSFKISVLCLSLISVSQMFSSWQQKLSDGSLTGYACIVLAYGLEKKNNGEAIAYGVFNTLAFNTIINTFTFKYEEHLGENAARIRLLSSVCSTLYTLLKIVKKRDRAENASSLRSVNPNRGVEA